MLTDMDVESAVCATSMRLTWEAEPPSTKQQKMKAAWDNHV